MSHHLKPQALFDTLDNLETQTLPSELCYDYAKYDYPFLKLFFHTYRHRLDTFNTYRRELERFIQ